MLRLPVLLLALLPSLATPNVQEPAEEAPPTRKVLIIGLDGFRGDGCTVAKTPVLDRLTEEGRFTDQAINGWEEEHDWNGHSSTNWGVLLTGVSPRVSELTANGDAEHRVRDDGEDGVPSLFGRVRAARTDLGTAVFHTWPGICQGDGAPLGRSKNVLDWVFCPEAGPTSAERDVDTVAAATWELRERADLGLVFVHLSQADSAGHGHTYGSPQYAEAVAQLDSLVGELLEAVAKRKQAKQEEWLVMVTSDHGGPKDGQGHVDNKNPEVRTIPLWIHGDGTGELADATLYDITPTALAWLGVPATDAEFQGKVRIQP